MAINVVYWVRGEDFADMAVVSAESIKRVYEGARVLVYADMSHETLNCSAIDEVIVIPYFNETPLMIANLQAQVHYCINGNFDRTTAFLDADVLAVHRAPLWVDIMPPEKVKHPQGAQWDLLVTQRDYVKRDEKGEKVVGVARQMPYNYGVFFVNPTEAGTETMIWLRERISRMSGQLQSWYGNQWALRELVGGTFTDDRPRIVKRQTAWCTVVCRVEDAQLWNYTPESEDESLSGKYFVHVKGDRKQMFLPIAERLVAA